MDYTLIKWILFALFITLAIILMSSGKPIL